MSGKKMSEQNKVLRNNIGITSLFLNDTFLEVSYKPKSVAEIKAKRIHIRVERFNELRVENFNELVNVIGLNFQLSTLKFSILN